MAIVNQKCTSDTKKKKVLTRVQSIGEVGVLWDFFNLPLSKNLETAVFGGGPSLPCRLLVPVEAISFRFRLPADSFPLPVSLVPPPPAGVVTGDGDA